MAERLPYEVLTETIPILFDVPEYFKAVLEQREMQDRVKEKESERRRDNSYR